MISNSKINQSEKSIELNFIDVKGINNITSICSLSNKNTNKIICDLSKEINSTYKVEPFICFDRNEAITIQQDNNIRGLPMQCQFTTEPPVDTTDNSAKETPPERTDNSKKKGGLSGGAVAGIIVGIIFIIIASVVAVIVYKKIKQKQKLKNSDNQIIISKFYEYPSNASNINF